MTTFSLPHIEDIDVEDVAALPGPYRYELRGGSLLVMPPTTFWHKIVVRELMVLLHSAGHHVLPDTGIRGDLPRDMRLPDLGVVTDLPSGPADCTTLPGSAFALVAEVVSAGSGHDERIDKLRWYADRGIAEYWIADSDPDHPHTDAVVHIHRLRLVDGVQAYELERSVRLSELGAERGAKIQA
ncbi:Uma2 family endonuclease [Actinoplanes sp. TRM 88003]|uniref:Uma2 family endonuclease n=1 Tax=Paractinoplanes aksuensis TaxID=2939490 RepID=A0ABT1E1D4_9ACTN|nr:Uma2 family endonuclease [Actinoplanes aksuensis]MCO8276934.1 Uma2 family endonuclease [Actinoplanes aksuensis]